VTSAGGSAGPPPQDNNKAPNDPWFTCLPHCETEVPCGQGRHVVRWEAGALRLPAHPDAEAELVLAALGGEKARCVEVAQAWQRHADDLSVLAIGPRGPDDRIAVGWDDVDAAQSRHAIGRSGPHSRPMHLGAVPPGSLPGGSFQPGSMSLASRPPAAALALAAARRRRVQEEQNEARLRRDDMLSLLALGHGFQVRLIGQVAAAHAAPGRGGPPDEASRPALVAAIAGRLAPVAERWLGIDPDQVVVTLLAEEGRWGSAELTGRGPDRRLRVSLPVGWLASVWACGLALVGRRLVVAVQQPGWPDARVLGLRSPGAEPEPLDVHASPGGPADAPHWEA
jgi:hypothetical protein